jgi:ABC-type phosphate/phosphonate transport system substrate-binding protein
MGKLTYLPFAKKRAGGGVTVANARMYSVSPAVAGLWRTLLTEVIATAGVPVTLIDHPAPAPLHELWSRTDQGAVFMCGLPFSRTKPQPLLVAAPVPAPAEFAGQARYWSDLVVRERSAFRTVDDTFGGRIALTVPDSQSGCVAALTYFMSAHGSRTRAGQTRPLFGEVIAPTLTPLGALTAVIEGAADIAPVDSYALRLMQAYRPDLTSQVRIVGQTAPTPIPPLVASPGAPAAPAVPPLVASEPGADLKALRSALLEAHQTPSTKGALEALLLARFTLPDPSSYAALRERFEATLRYWTLHRFASVTHPAFTFGI